MNTPLENLILKELQVFNSESPQPQQLSLEQQQWFVQTWSRIIRRAAKKMVEGQRKYGGNFFTDCDHLDELDNELVDAVHYNAGERHRRVKLANI